MKQPIEETSTLLWILAWAVVLTCIMVICWTTFMQLNNPPVIPVG